MTTVNELLNEAGRLKDGDPIKIKLIEQAIISADQSNDLGLKYTSRVSLIEAATFSGQPEKALVNFAWCIAQCEKLPEQFPLVNILWKYKYVVDCAIGFHTISHAKLVQLMNNMEQHYKQAGFSLRPVHYMRAHLYLNAGQFEESLQQLQISMGLENDRFADCSACEIHFLVKVLVALKRDQEAIQTALPLIQGNERCAEVPHLTLSELLISTSRLGNSDLGKMFLTNGYQLIRDNPEFLHQVGLQMQYCATHELLDTGLDRLQNHLTWLLTNTDQRGCFEYQLGAAMLLKTLLQRNKNALSLRLPNKFELFNDSAEYDTQSLFNYFNQRALTTAKAFDERNGNLFYQQQLRDKLTTAEEFNV
jgi:hypothetical protein